MSRHISCPRFPVDRIDDKYASISKPLSAAGVTKAQNPQFLSMAVG